MLLSIYGRPLLLYYHVFSFHSSAWFGSQDVKYRITVKVSETQLKLHNAAVSIQSALRMHSARKAFLSGDHSALTVETGDSGETIFRFTDDEAPRSNLVPALLRQQVVKPVDTPASIRTSIKQLQAKVQALDEKVERMGQEVATGEAAVVEAKVEIAESETAEAAARARVADLHGQLRELGVTDLDSGISEDNLPVGMVETTITVF